MTSMNESETRMRVAEVAACLQRVHARIEDACRAAHRSNDVALLVVTKTFPASDVEILSGLGVTQIGENRDQEAKAKRADLADVPMVWHMIGQVQRNKAASIARWADVVESVDRLAVVEALSRGAVQADRLLEVRIQVNLDPEERPERGGVAPSDALELAEAVAAASGLRLGGVMGVAPGPTDVGDADSAFALLEHVHTLIRAKHPDARAMSAGMSGDLELAISHGATQVRIGGAILGSRPLVQ
jgi:pyridoxal phosphate enzyme (YggS family)